MTRGCFARALRPLVLLVTLLLAACEGGEPQHPSEGAQIVSAPAASVAVSWCSVKKILDRNCVACHANPPINNAPLALTSYAELTMVSPLSPDQKVYETVVATVRAERGVLGRYSPMPPTGPLQASDLALLEGWAAQGAQAGASPVCPP